MDPRRFSTIAHANHEFASPITVDRALQLMKEAGLHSGAHILDIGCGFGAWSVLAANHGATVTAVDPNQEFIRRGQLLSEKVTWVNEAYSPHLTGTTSQDIVLCIGSTQALGGLEPTLEECARVLRPNGTVLIGEGYWRRTPDPDYLAILGSEPDEMTTHAQVADRITKQGWHVIFSTTATQHEWDTYEGHYRSNMVRWLSANPLDPDAVAFRQRSDKWYETYLTMGRDTLGFGYYIAMR